MKTAMHVFGAELLPRLGIKGKLKAVIPTESVVLEMAFTYSDFNYLNEYGHIIHVEFESGNPGLNGLKQNRVREVLLSRHFEAPVITYIIYSGNAKNPMTEFTEGINTYRIIPIILKKENADELFEKLHKKVDAGKQVTKADIISLLLTPVMAGNMSQYKRISQALKLLQSNEHILMEPSKYETVLFAFANKFLETNELSKIKEEFAMTKLGEYLYNDAKTETTIKTIKNMLKKQMPYELIAEVTEISIEFVKEVSETPPEEE